MTTPASVPFHRPSIGKEEIDEVVKTLESGWLTTGPRTAQFEKEFRNYVGAGHALGVTSGTAALHLALLSLGIGPGDEVITTPITFCATVNMIIRVGATPVLADVGPDGNIDPDAVAARINPNTRAILPVHMAGLPCEMDALRALARRHGLLLVEDAAHATGSRYHGCPIGGGEPAAGTASDAVAFSFHPTKNLTTGEGGMLTAHDPGIAEKMRLLSLHGLSKNAWNRYSDRGHWYYEVLLAGFKYNMTDIQASIGIHQLRKLDEFIRIRTSYAKRYEEIFSGVEELELPPDKPDCRHAWHLYGLRLRLEKLSIDRGAFIEEMKARGVGASVHFIPVTLHPFFGAYAERPENRCPRAEALYRRLISMPLYPAMTESQLEYAAETVKQIARKCRVGKAVCAGAAVP